MPHDVVAPRDDQGRRFAPAIWLTRVRKQARLSQDALARRLEVSSMTISKRERGVSEISWESWLGILHSLGLPADWEPPAGEVGADDGEPETPEPATLTKKPG